MSLLNCSDSAALTAFPTIACLLLLAGCSSLPVTDSNTGAKADAAAVPPDVLTKYEQAMAIMAAGNAVEAELRLAEFLLQYPEYPGAHVNMAILQARAGADEQAESSILAALELEPKNAAALNQLGMLRRRQGRFDDAAQAYLAALDADPSYALPHYNLGVLNELYLRRLDTALLHFSKFRELGGEDPKVDKWIVDLKRRIAASQRAAKVTE